MLPLEKGRQLKRKYVGSLRLLMPGSTPSRLVRLSLPAILLASVACLSVLALFLPIGEVRLLQKLAHRISPCGAAQIAIYSQIVRDHFEKVLMLILIWALESMFYPWSNQH